MSADAKPSHTSIFIYPSIELLGSIVHNEFITIRGIDD